VFEPIVSICPREKKAIVDFSKFHSTAPISNLNKSIERKDVYKFLMKKCSTNNSLISKSNQVDVGEEDQSEYEHDLNNNNNKNQTEAEYLMMRNRAAPIAHHHHNSNGSVKYLNEIMYSNDRVNSNLTNNKSKSQNKLNLMLKKRQKRSSENCLIHQNQQHRDSVVSSYNNNNNNKNNINQNYDSNSSAILTV
jgi:hypothetical protein